MKRYAVSMLFTKQSIGGPIINNQLTLDFVEAENENEAFGIAYNLKVPRLPEHQLFLKLVRHIEETDPKNTLTT